MHLVTGFFSDSNYPSLDTLDNNNSAQAKICHKPTLSDILVGYPTQRGYIAYRKPEVGSWYMNAIVAVFSRHACDTDLCALLNMVNSLISDEVTNTGKKQMSEYTSKLTKPYFYFFPGLATETQAAGASQEVADCQSKENVDEGEGLGKQAQSNRCDWQSLAINHYPITIGDFLSLSNHIRILIILKMKLNI